MRPSESEPLGQRTNAIRWIQKLIENKAAQLPTAFETRSDWEQMRNHIRAELPRVIGVPRFGPMGPARVRGGAQVGEDVNCLRVDIHLDDDYAIPAFQIEPLTPPAEPMPALLWNPGWPESKWKPAYQQFAVRLARQGFVVLLLDHAPFGETTPYIGDQKNHSMTLVMGGGHLLGISQLGLRAAETIRGGEYLRSLPQVDPQRVTVAGLCQGGQDTWLSAALDERFNAAAIFCASTTYAVHFGEMASYFYNGDVSPFPFGILNVCDIQHLYGCIAPRPLLVRANLGDTWWPISGYDTVHRFTRDIYGLYGAENRIDFRAETHEHNLTGPFADALERFMLGLSRCETDAISF